MNLKFIVGATGCGKTTLAQHISNTDVIISLDAFSKSIRYVFPDFKLYGKDISIKPTKIVIYFLTWYQNIFSVLSVIILIKI